MMNARVVILSALLLAMMAALSRRPALPVRRALPAIDWRNAMPS
jgi:hypothetical protein